MGDVVVARARAGEVRRRALSSERQRTASLSLRHKLRRAWTIWMHSLHSSLQMVKTEFRLSLQHRQEHGERNQASRSHDQIRRPMEVWHGPSREDETVVELFHSLLRMCLLGPGLM